MTSLSHAGAGRLADLALQPYENREEAHDEAVRRRRDRLADLALQPYENPRGGRMTGLSDAVGGRLVDLVLQPCESRGEAA